MKFASLNRRKRIINVTNAIIYVFASVALFGVGAFIENIKGPGTNTLSGLRTELPKCVCMCVHVRKSEGGYIFQYSKSIVA